LINTIKFYYDVLEIKEKIINLSWMKTTSLSRIESKKFSWVKTAKFVMDENNKICHG